MAWPDERLDDLGDRMHAGFERVHGEIAGVRDELKGDIAGVRDELKGDIAGVRDELKGDIAGVRDELKGTRAELKGDIDGLHGLMLRMWVTMTVGLLGIIGALLAIGLSGGAPGGQ